MITVGPWTLSWTWWFHGAGAAWSAPSTGFQSCWPWILPAGGGAACLGGAAGTMAITPRPPQSSWCVDLQGNGQRLECWPPDPRLCSLGTPTPQPSRLFVPGLLDEVLPPVLGGTAGPESAGLEAQEGDGGPSAGIMDPLVGVLGGGSWGSSGPGMPCCGQISGHWLWRSWTGRDDHGPGDSHCSGPAGQLRQPEGSQDAVCHCQSQGLGQP